MLFSYHSVIGWEPPGELGDVKLTGTSSSPPPVPRVILTILQKGAFKVAMCVETGARMHVAEKGL